MPFPASDEWRMELGASGWKERSMQEGVRWDVADVHHMCEGRSDASRSGFAVLGCYDEQTWKRSDLTVVGRERRIIWRV